MNIMLFGVCESQYRLFGRSGEREPLQNDLRALTEGTFNFHTGVGKTIHPDPLSSLLNLGIYYLHA